MNTTESYVPGVCNINRAEIAYRRKAGYFGLGLFIVVAIVFIALGINRWAYLILFVPAFIAAIGFLQAKNRFCVAYGAGGQQNATEGSAAATKVTDMLAAKKDKQRARQMNLQAALLAIVATALSVGLLPLINQ